MAFYGGHGGKVIHVELSHNENNIFDIYFYTFFENSLLG